MLEASFGYSLGFMYRNSSQVWTRNDPDSVQPKASKRGFQKPLSTGRLGYPVGCSARQQLLHVDIFEVQVPLQMEFEDEWVGRPFMLGTVLWVAASNNDGRCRSV